MVLTSLVPSPGPVGAQLITVTWKNRAPESKGSSRVPEHGEGSGGRAQGVVVGGESSKGHVGAVETLANDQTRSESPSSARRSTSRLSGGQLAPGGLHRTTESPCGARITGSGPNWT